MTDTDFDCVSCKDTGWASAGFEFSGNEIKEPCPCCGAGADMTEQVRLSNEIVAEVIADERAGRTTGSSLSADHGGVHGAPDQRQVTSDG